MSHDPKSLKKLRTRLIGLLVMPVGGFISGVLLSGIGFNFYYGRLNQSLQVEAVENGRLPSQLVEKGVKLTVKKDPNDAEVKNFTLTYGSKSVEWKRDYDLSWSFNEPTFISAYVDDDEIPELISIFGSVRSGASNCWPASSFTVFNFSEPALVTSCDLPDKYRLYLTERYHSFFDGASLTTAFRVACLFALLFPIGFWTYRARQRQHD